MRSLFRKTKEEIQSKDKHPFAKGVLFAALSLCLIAFFIGGFYFRTGLSPWLQAGVYLLAACCTFFVFRFTSGLLITYLKKIKTYYWAIALSLLASLAVASAMRFSWPNAIYYQSIALGFVALSLCFGGILSVFSGKSGKGFYIVLTIAGVALGYFSLKPILNAGENPYPLEVAQFIPEKLPSFDLENPGQKGNYEVEYFTYGSGTDERRAAFRDSVRIKTAPVDATVMLPEWRGKKKKWRERYWGFGLANAPLNGRVWMPKSGDKLPLILIVHGNHGMEHHSDPGYQYLGELLASRGFITVSVDENFINGTWSGDFRGKEMPARAWFLLKHLEQWQKWSEDASSALFEKADLDNVILMGHSRGGEAVSIAAAFNKLQHHPDDANITFDFNFGIKGLVAIAPTDIRYHRRIELKDVNYLSLQGTYDADEASFFGLRQYQRVSFSDSSDYFKAGVLIHRANHGQFNSIWGRRDFGEPYGWFLNTGPLLTGEEQRETAKVFIAAFAEKLFNDKDYTPLFEQPYVAKDWLPETFYLSNYSDSHHESLIDFEDGIDLVNKEKATIKAENLLVWHEEELAMRGGDSQGTNAVILGWDNDSTGTTAQYEIKLRDSLLLSPNEILTFSMGRTKDAKIDTEDDASIRFTVELETSQGPVKLKPEAFKELAPLLHVKYMKLDKMNGSFGNTWELNMETFTLPIGITENTYLKKLRFVFDQSAKGIIALDNIGINESQDR